MATELTVADIIKASGGPSPIQTELERMGQPITRDAIYKWRLTGIPDRHWPAIIALTCYGPSELYQANCLARGIARVPEAAE